jgi:hypothetical protein
MFPCAWATLWHSCAAPRHPGGRSAGALGTYQPWRFTNSFMKVARALTHAGSTAL